MLQLYSVVKTCRRWRTCPHSDTESHSREKGSVADLKGSLQCILPGSHKYGYRYVMCSQPTTLLISSLAYIIVLMQRNCDNVTRIANSVGVAATSRTKTGMQTEINLNIRLSHHTHSTPLHIQTVTADYRIENTRISSLLFVPASSYL